MFTKIAQGGKVIACGSISTYNDVDKSIFTNWFDVIAMRITISGMIVLDWMSEAPQVVGKLVQAYKEKKLSIEGGETIVDTKFEDIPKTWLKYV
jgi:NADPH-dependent curcumin reductase CurA